MNYARIAMAAVAATVVDGIYGFLVYGMLLVNEFARYPAVYRSNEAGMAYLPLMFAGILVGMLGAAYIYAKGYDGGSGIAEGARFGMLLGVFIAAIFAGVNYATLNIGRRHSLYMAVAGFVEWTLAGVVIGLVYRPAASATR
jgi:hypothetical protein